MRKWPLGMTERHCPFLWRRLRAVTIWGGRGGATRTPCPARQPTVADSTSLHGYFVSHLSFWGREAEAWELTPWAVSR